MTQGLSTDGSHDKRSRVFHAVVVMGIRLGVLLLLVSISGEQLREENGLGLGTFIVAGLFGLIVALHSPSARQIRLDLGKSAGRGRAGRTHLESPRRKMLVRVSRLVVAAWLLMLAVLWGQSGYYLFAMLLVIAAASVAWILGPVTTRWYARVLGENEPQVQAKVTADAGSKTASVHWSQNRKLIFIAFFFVYPFMVAFAAVVTNYGSVGSPWSGGIGVAIAYPLLWRRVRELFD